MANNLLVNLHELLNKKLIIVSGKGGVGKTSVAAALGLIASRQGKNTLIAEINAPERIASLFGIKKVGYQETSIAENLSAINIDPRSAFEEYILEQIHSKRLYKLVFEHKFVRNFLDATPGLNELLEIGKVWSLSEKYKNSSGEKPKYDLIIVDAPATGHGLAFLDVPQVVTQAIRVGPLKNKASQISELIRNKLKTILLIVTLAEEMPVNESLEMIQKAKKEIKIATGPLIVNALFPTPFEAQQAKEVKEKLDSNLEDSDYSEISKILHLFQKRSELQKFYLNKLQLTLDKNSILQIPFIFRPRFDRNAIEEFSKHLAHSLDIHENTTDWSQS